MWNVEVRKEIFLFKCMQLIYESASTVWFKKCAYYGFQYEVIELKDSASNSMNFTTVEDLRRTKHACIL